VVLAIPYAEADRLILEVDATETRGERWALLDLRTRTLQPFADDWLIAAGIDRRRRVLLCAEGEARVTCGWSAPLQVRAP